MIVYTNLQSFISGHPDYNIQGYFDLLSQLTVCSPFDITNHLRTIMSMGTIIVAVSDNQIIGSGTVIIEPKIIHGGQCVGHIEDIVVHSEWRGHGIAKTIVQKLYEYAVSKNCYKTILDCSTSVSGLYESCGFIVSGVQLRRSIQ